MALAAPAEVSTIPPEELASYRDLPEPLKRIIGYALGLSSRNLTYTFGSEDPSDGGMDCSGTMYHLLRTYNLRDIPRQSNEIHKWVESSGRLTKVTGTPALGDAALRNMRPGDLLFWSGTYSSGRGEGAVTHVMMYLGKTTDGRAVMFGASDGRPYQGKRRNGVSVFDFRIPRAEGKSKFVGYGPIPGVDISRVKPDPPVPEVKREAAKEPAKKKQATGEKKSSKSGKTESSTKKPKAAN